MKKVGGRQICLVIAAILLLLAVIPTWLWARIRSDFVEQTAAERWRGRNPARFAQVTAFLECVYVDNHNLNVICCGKISDFFYMELL